MADKGLLKRKIVLATFATGLTLVVVNTFGALGAMIYEDVSDPTSDLLTKYDYVSFNDQYKLEQIKELDQKYSKDSPEYMAELNLIMNTDYEKTAFLKQTGDEIYAKWEKTKKTVNTFAMASGCLSGVGLVIALPSAVIIDRSNKMQTREQKRQKEITAVLAGVTYENKPLDGEYQSNNENE